MSRVIAAFAQFFNGEGAPLALGWLKFLETNTNNSLKPTYADADQTIANANPLQLDAEGRCPNVFGQGLYRVVLYENNPVINVPGAMLQTFDPVTAQYVNTGNGSGNFGDWDISEIYQVGQVVLYAGIYYRSIVANNIGNQPDLNTDKWEVIEFLRVWNADVTYAEGDPAFYDAGLYFSLSDGNMGNQPDISPIWWNSTQSTVVDFAWSAIEVYDAGNIVYYDGLYYRSIAGSNVGNQPDLNLDKWEIIDFLRIWNDAVSYNANDIVIYDGKFYVSIAGSNLNNQPDISPTFWDNYPFKNWVEDGTSFVPTASGNDIGSSTYLVGDIYQGDNSHHYFGDGQDTDFYFDSLDFYAITNGNFILGSNAAFEIIFQTNNIDRWYITADGHFAPDTNLDIGTALLPIGDFYQGDNQHLYIGDSQDIDLTFDSTDLYISIGANAWALLANGSVIPQTDDAFYIGGASNRIKQIYVSDAPVDDNNVVRLTDLTEINLGGRKNLVDNGNLKIWQRGTASIALDGNLLADRFKGAVLAWTSATQQQANLSLSEIEITGGLEYALRIDTSGGPTATDAYATLFYHDFNFYQYADKTITFSIYAKTGSGNLEIGVRLLQIFGSGGSASVATSPQNITINGTLDRYNLQFTMPSIVGKTIGTDPYMRCDITIAAAGTYLTSSGSANQDGTFYITGIQIEENFFPTFFEYRSKQNTLLDCLPYYQKSYNHDVLPGTASVAGYHQVWGFESTSSPKLDTVSFSKMSITPAITLYDYPGNSGKVTTYIGTTATDNVTPNAVSPSQSGASVYVANSTITGFLFHWVADTGY